MKNDEQKYFIEQDLQSDLDRGIATASHLLKREYLNCLVNYTCQSSQEITEIEDLVEKSQQKEGIAEFSSFYRITKLVYEKDESFLDKLLTTCRQIYVGGDTLAILVQSDGAINNYYIGLVHKHLPMDVPSSTLVYLKDSLLSNFEGSEITQLQGEDVNNLSALIGESTVVSSISMIPSFREEGESDIEKYVQGIEKLVNSLSGKAYSILTIADPIPFSDIQLVKSNLEQVYSQLSSFAKREISMNENTTVSLTKQQSKSFADTVSHNSTISQSHTNTTGWSKSTSEGKSRSSIGSAIALGVAGAAVAGITIATGGIAALAAAPIAGAAVSAIPAIGGAVAGAFGQKQSGKQQGTNGSASDQEGKTEGEGNAKTYTVQEGDSVGKSVGTGQTVTLSYENCTIKGLLSDIESQLARIKLCENYGSFSTCTYVLTRNIEDNISVAGGYCALLSGDNSNSQVSAINRWSSEEKDINAKTNFTSILSYLKMFTHPMFESDGISYTSASMMSGKELSIQMGFPKKSISGLSVVEKAAFGRNISRSVQDETRKISVGNLSYMGVLDESRTVDLDVDSLTSHVFVTGSTGTGKSNTVYKLIEKLSGISDDAPKFLIIEPAKGEYKHAFFDHPTIKMTVYGTNPAKTELLRINPFSFLGDIHVLEHIDRLVEIMNVCWPMYAAMPAILKNAVIEAYKNCGWDITNSINKRGMFPSFYDVLSCVTQILDRSAYSNDNKGDYTGALCTRIESLTNGINGQIFVSNELSYTDLFDNNAIIDLSRVGSGETKSLIMGLLVLKLQEFRQSENLPPNQKLRHITILEEAHNILKRTSTEQNAESSNLAGKSVEMISNAIAEMRTFGEGFIIVDQAPSSLDVSTIRNTNTKIVLRLPERDDRELVGKAMALNDNQIAELSKLDKGEAVVYQNNWEEAVLCKFGPYHKDYKNIDMDLKQFSYEGKRILTESEKKKEVIKYFIDKVVDNKPVRTIEIEDYINSIATLRSETKREYCQKAKEDRTLKISEISPLVYALYNCDDALAIAKSANTIEKWEENLLIAMDPELMRMNTMYINDLIQCVLVERALNNSEESQLMNKWLEYKKEGTK